MAKKPYRREQLPQWDIHDVLKHNYSHYFGIQLTSNLHPTQDCYDYQLERTERKLRLFRDGYFDPIITDCDLNIICGHHRHKALVDTYGDFYCPIICLEGVTVEMVVDYYQSYCLHQEAVLEYQAEVRAIEDYDYIKIKQDGAKL